MKNTLFIILGCLLGLALGPLAISPSGFEITVARAAEVFGGVGVLLDHDPQNPQNVLIFSVTYKSPADKAKVHRGERLLKIDGADVTGLSLQQLADKIRGPAGSQVVLTLTSPAGDVHEVPLTREAITSGPIVSVPPPNMASTGVFFSPEEKALIKQKIIGLSTDEQREKMMNLLKALKSKQITKAQFMGFLKSDF